MSNKKPKRDVWVPRPVIVMIGKTDYTIEPQPMRRYLEFEAELRELLGGFMPLGLGGEVAEEDVGQEGDDGDAAEEAEVAEEAVAKGLVERGVETVYRILTCVIPDLKYDDVLDASEPQLEHVIEVCLRLNGGRWAESLIRDFLGPLLPALQGMLAEWLLTRTAPLESGEAPPTTS